MERLYNACLNVGVNIFFSEDQPSRSGKTEAIFFEIELQRVVASKATYFSRKHLLMDVSAKMLYNLRYIYWCGIRVFVSRQKSLCAPFRVSLAVRPSVNVCQNLHVQKVNEPLGSKLPSGDNCYPIRRVIVEKSC